jgi:hypothetical protein
MQGSHQASRSYLVGEYQYRHHLVIHEPGRTSACLVEEQPSVSRSLARKRNDSQLR